jgi:hypothetical protein
VFVTAAAHFHYQNLFFVPLVTNYKKLGDLKQEKFIFSSSEGQKNPKTISLGRNQGVHGLHFLATSF